jgi:hypothetical protein
VRPGAADGLRSRGARADRGHMPLFIGLALALWLCVSVVVVSLCLAAARGDRALMAGEELPGLRDSPSVATAPVAQQQRAL